MDSMEILSHAEVGGSYPLNQGCRLAVSRGTSDGPCNVHTAQGGMILVALVAVHTPRSMSRSFGRQSFPRWVKQSYERAIKDEEFATWLTL